MDLRKELAQDLQQNINYQINSIDQKLLKSGYINKDETLNILNSNKEVLFAKNPGEIKKTFDQNICNDISETIGLKSNVSTDAKFISNLKENLYSTNSNTKRNKTNHTSFFPEKQIEKDNLEKEMLNKNETQINQAIDSKNNLYYTFSKKGEDGKVVSNKKDANSKTNLSNSARKNLNRNILQYKKAELKEKAGFLGIDEIKKTKDETIGLEAIENQIENLTKQLLNDDYILQDLTTKTQKNPELINNEQYHQGIFKTEVLKRDQNNKSAPCNKNQTHIFNKSRSNSQKKTTTVHNWYVNMKKQIPGNTNRTRDVLTNNGKYSKGTPDTSKQRILKTHVNLPSNSPQLLKEKFYGKTFRNAKNIKYPDNSLVKKSLEHSADKKTFMQSAKENSNNNPNSLINRFFLKEINKNDLLKFKQKSNQISNSSTQKSKQVLIGKNAKKLTKFKSKERLFQHTHVNLDLSNRLEHNKDLTADRTQSHLIDNTIIVNNENMAQKGSTKSRTRFTQNDDSYLRNRSQEYSSVIDNSNVKMRNLNENIHKNVENMIKNTFFDNIDPKYSDLINFVKKDDEDLEKKKQSKSFSPTQKQFKVNDKHIFYTNIEKNVLNQNPSNVEVDFNMSFGRNFDTKNFIKELQTRTQQNNMLGFKTGDQKMHSEIVNSKDYQTMLKKENNDNMSDNLNAFEGMTDSYNRKNTSDIKRVMTDKERMEIQQRILDTENVGYIAPVTDKCIKKKMKSYNMTYRTNSSNNYPNSIDYYSKGSKNINKVNLLKRNSSRSADIRTKEAKIRNIVDHVKVEKDHCKVLTKNYKKSESNDNKSLVGRKNSNLTRKSERSVNLSNQINNAKKSKSKNENKIRSTRTVTATGSTHFNERSNSGSRKQKPVFSLTSEKLNNNLKINKTEVDGFNFNKKNFCYGVTSNTQNSDQEKETYFNDIQNTYQKMQSIKEQQIEQIKKIREEKEMEECTFKPQIYSKKKCKTALSFNQRQLKWKEKKNTKQDVLKTHQYINESKNCPFSPGDFLNENIGKSYDKGLYDKQKEWYENVRDSVELEKELLYKRNSKGHHDLTNFNTTPTASYDNKFMTDNSMGFDNIKNLYLKSQIISEDIGTSPSNNDDSDRELVTMKSHTGGNEGQSDQNQELKDAQNIFTKLHMIFDTKNNLNEDD